MRDEVSIPALRPSPSTSPSTSPGPDQASGGASGGASVQAFKLDHTGLARIFGDLEARVMRIIWQLEEATVSDVLTRLGDDHHYNTVMTVMSRLADKSILSRRREGRAHVYVPVEDRDRFLARVSRDVAEGLLREFGAVAIAQFIDAADAVDPGLLAELRQRVRDKADDENT